MTASATTPSIAPAWALRVSQALSHRWHNSSRSTADRLHPHAKHIPHSQRALWPMVLRAAQTLIQRVFIAEAVLWLTAAGCALAGFPVALTAFCVALVGLVVNLWLAVRTLAPLCRKLWKGGRA